MFNKVSSILATCCVFLLIVGTTQAAVTELVTNGGFESGSFSGWEQLPGNAVQAISTDNPSSGIYSANFITTNPAANLLRQNMGAGLLTAGQPVTISFDYRGTAQNGGVFFAELFSVMSNGALSATELLGGAPLFPNANADVWTTATFTTNTGPDVSGGITLSLNTSCGADAGCLADYLIDNVSITIEADSDDDGLVDSQDNCTTVANAAQLDFDADGIGNRCDGDFDQNCTPNNFSDLAIMQVQFFTPGQLNTDMNGDGNTNFADLSLFATVFFLPPGPSGIPNICDGD